MAGIKQIKVQRPEGGNTQDYWLLEALDNHLTVPQRPPRQGVFYPSSLGSKCDRFLYNSYFGLVQEETISPNTKRIFDCGDYLGYRYEKYFEKMGVLVSTETPLKSDSPPLSGRLDFLIKHDQKQLAVIELKSIGASGFKALTKKPKDEHFIQLQIYLALTGHEYGVVLYENKDNQKVKAFSVIKDDEVWKQLVDRCTKIMAMKEQPSVCTGLRYCPCKREQQ